MDLFLFEKTFKRLICYKSRTNLWVKDFVILEKNRPYYSSYNLYGPTEILVERRNDKFWSRDLYIGYHTLTYFNPEKT